MTLSKFTLLKAIVQCHNNADQLAKLIQVTPQKIQDWLLMKEKISYPYATLIEQVTECNVSRFDLAPHLRFSKYITYQSIGQKILLSNDYESEVLIIEDEHLNPMKPYSKRTETIDLKNEEGDYQAKYVMKQGVYKLLEAMDLETISIPFAYQIALLPIPLQEQCLLLTPAQIQAQLFCYTCNSRINAQGFIEAIKSDKRLIIAEKNTKKPLRMALLTLILLKAEFLFFRDDIDELFQTTLDLSLDTLLPMLQDWGWISFSEKGRLNIDYPFEQLVSA